MACLSQPVITASAESTQTVNNYVHISLQNVIEQIEGFSSEKLSENDKNAIKELLYSLEGVKATKDKGKLWEKSKSILQYLLDKGMDVAVAVLPYILNGLQ